VNQRNDQGYPRSELLAEPDWLWECRDDPTTRIVDCGTEDAYERAHIPEAVALSVHPWIKEPEDGLHVMGPESFSQLMEGLGVSDETTVVCYDDFNTTFAARLWWVLNYYGHTDAKVLNGGWHRWVLEERPVTFQPTEPQPGRFTPRQNEQVICRLDYLKEKFDDPGVTVLNVLPEGHFRGQENPLENQRVGHIPGSINLPIEAFLVDDDRGVFKEAGELESLLANSGVSADKETVVHCQAGVRTALGFLVLSLMGTDCAPMTPRWQSGQIVRTPL
jgi:thiosulfate/3-mercaptopyruvate sulfurtransferase